MTKLAWRTFTGSSSSLGLPSAGHRALHLKLTYTLLINPVFPKRMMLVVTRYALCIMVPGLIAIDTVPTQHTKLEDRFGEKQ